MAERRNAQRSRTLKGGKILFNNRRSVISCTVRNLSTEGAHLQVDSALGIPAFFDLALDGEGATRPCDVIWKADNRLGVAFGRPASVPAQARHRADDKASAEASAAGAVRGDLLSLRAALDEVPIGIVLLDAKLRAQFINRAFRAMWHLPDAKAESRPAFVTLMYHGRDTRAYDVPDSEVDRYVEARVAHVREGKANPLDLRLTSGEIIRFQCTSLPAGGRMLSYTDVTDIVRRADELERVRAALDNLEQGIVLLDEKLDVQFINAACRTTWRISDERAAAKPPFADLVADARQTGIFGMTGDALEIYIAQRIARVRAGDPRPMDLRHQDGRIIRSTCSVLPNGGRMLSYFDVTDLVRRADDARKVALQP
jgi:PAS domain-containing protein